MKLTGLRSRNNLDNIIEAIAGLAAVLLFFLGWCIDTLSYRWTLFSILYLFFNIATISLYFLIICKQRNSEGGLPKQFAFLNVCLFVCFGSVLCSDLFRGKGNIFNIFTDVIWIIVTGKISSNVKISIKNAVTCAHDTFISHKSFFLLLIILVILALEPFQLQFRWDGALYEQACSEMSIHSLSSLGAYGHLSQAYGTLYYLIWSIVGSVDYAMAVLNLLLYLGSVTGIYVFINELQKEKDTVCALLLTTLYACSPYLLGMVNYYSLDYMAACIFVWVIYFAYCEKWILHYMAAILFVFTKEPAIVTYGAFCIGVVVLDIKNNGIRKVVDRIQYYFMLSIACMWFALYSVIGGWSGGEGQFSFDIEYVIDKLQVLYILNFSWLIVLLIFITAACSRKKNRIVQYCIPVVLSIVAYTVFSIMFKTVNHARYTAMVPAGLYIILIIFLLSSKTINISIRNSIVALLDICMLLSVYKTVDPMTLYCFENVNIGNEMMITTGDYAIGDSMIYNKQMLCEETVLNQALGYALNQEYNIYIPMYSGAAYSFDGLMTDNISSENSVFQTIQFWDDVKQRRTFKANSQTKVFILNEISNEKEIEYDRPGCYIYSDILGQEIANEIKNKDRNAMYKEFDYKSWKLYMFEF